MVDLMINRVAGQLRNRTALKIADRCGQELLTKRGFDRC